MLLGLVCATLGCEMGRVIQGVIMGVLIWERGVCKE